MSKKFKNSIFSIIIIIILSVFSGLFINENNSIDINDDLEIHFIDVGQGDSTLLVSKGEAILIDGGERFASSKVVSYIENLGITKIKYIIATHPHSDHISGLIGVMNKFKVNNIIKNEENISTGIYDSFLKKSNEKNIKVIIPKLGDEFIFGEAQFKIIGPTAYNFDTNNNSLAIRVTHGENSVLFTGDGEKLEESTLMYTGMNIQSNILHVGHHGSRNASSTEFLNEVNPDYVIISVGKDNIYGHPHREALDRFKKQNIKILRTDILGDILMISDGKDVIFSSEK